MGAEAGFSLRNGGEEGHEGRRRDEAVEKLPWRGVQSADRAGGVAGRENGAEDRAVWAEASHERAGAGHKVFPHLLAGVGDRPPEPGVVLGHHVHPDGAGLLLPDSGDGLVQPEGAGLGGVDDDGCGAVSGGVPDGGEGGGRAPEITNTDQGIYSSLVGNGSELEKHEGLRISIDGKDRSVDRMFVEQLCWSMKCAKVEPEGYESPLKLERGLAA